VNRFPKGNHGCNLSEDLKSFMRSLAKEVKRVAALALKLHDGVSNLLNTGFGVARYLNG
jgi:hypothetical protein